MIQAFIQCAVVGLVAWAICYLLPIPEKMKTLIYVVAVIVALLIIAAAFGINTGVKIP